MQPRVTEDEILMTSKNVNNRGLRRRDIFKTTKNKATASSGGRNINDI